MSHPDTSLQLTIKSRIEYAPGFCVDEFDVTTLAPRFRAPFETSLFRVDPGSASIPESHADTELWLVAAGSGTLIYGEHVSDIFPGQAIALVPHVVHQVVNTGSVPIEIFSLWWTEP
jgi:mannose-6-phosphate isomerase-like protein (cupin superfamily)